MIETLRIENVAIVERAELEFGPGLNVLTGETGAGKSIVLGALALLAGGRASAGLLRQGAEAATVEALFRTEALPELEADLAARGLDGEPHELVVSRQVGAAGRSRARVSGGLVPVGALAELFQGRLEISSQHDSQALLRPETHGWLLDRLGGLLDRRRAVSDGHAALRELDAALEALREQARDRERRRDFLAFQVEEIDEARLDPAELADARATESRLAHAGRLREEGGVALAQIAGDPLGSDAPNAADLLADASRQIESLARLDPALGDVAERLHALQSEVRDVALDLERHLDGIEDDPARLAALEERLHRVEQLQRKYGGNVEEVLRFRDEAAAELAALDGAEEREAELLRERDERVARLEADAKKLTEGRRKASRKLARVVEAALRDLGMPEARFAVALDPAEPPEGLPCGPSGREHPEFRFSANAGEELRPLRKVASGGELSRAFLALKGALREHGAGMVLVFDEVDAGIGGRAADRVGRALAEIARHNQVLCITHLPQIAAFANVHFRVEKSSARGRTQARITRIDGDERVAEIARMAGGEQVGQATLRHARELLSSRSD
ncbi:MAG: DNA repair protein RecN [Myxococcota bacterium]|nr:DNA repair protein RecN [Myxococcota bacterium]